MQARQSGWSRLPPWTGLVFPQAEHSAHRCWQRLHHGRPVAIDVSHGASRPQIAHVATGTGRQPGHTGPPGARTATGRRRPHLLQSSWLAGSVIRQCGHNGRPCSSRVAASRTAPQREHGRARDLAVQLRHSHCPPTGRCRWITRPQPGQAGRTIACAPASHSRSIRRRTAGTGASAPAPVSNPGRSCSAQASGRRCPARGTADSTAAVTASAVSDGSTLVTTSAITATGSSSPGGH